MNQETRIQHQSEPQSEASRTQRIKHIAPAVLLAGGLVAGYGVSNLDAKDSERHEIAFAATAVSHHASVEIGRSDEGWGHGAAEAAIRQAVKEGLSYASAPDGSNESLDIAHIMKTLPVYEQAEQALEMARYNEVMPDPGDKLVVSVELAPLHSDNTVSYRVIDADIIDIENNQQ